MTKSHARLKRQTYLSNTIYGLRDAVNFHQEGVGRQVLYFRQLIILDTFLSDISDGK